MISDQAKQSCTLNVLIRLTPVVYLTLRSGVLDMANTEACAQGAISWLQPAGQQSRWLDQMTTCLQLVANLVKMNILHQQVDHPVDSNNSLMNSVPLQRTGNFRTSRGIAGHVTDPQAVQRTPTLMVSASFVPRSAA